MSFTNKVALAQTDSVWENSPKLKRECSVRLRSTVKCCPAATHTLSSAAAATTVGFVFTCKASKSSNFDDLFVCLSFFFLLLAKHDEVRTALWSHVCVVVMGPSWRGDPKLWGGGFLCVWGQPVGEGSAVCGWGIWHHIVMWQYHVTWRQGVRGLYVSPLTSSFGEMTVLVHSWYSAVPPSTRLPKLVDSSRSTSSTSVHIFRDQSVLIQSLSRHKRKIFLLENRSKFPLCVMWPNVILLRCHNIYIRAFCCLNCVNAALKLKSFWSLNRSIYKLCKKIYGLLLGHWLRVKWRITTPLGIEVSFRIGALLKQRQETQNWSFWEGEWKRCEEIAGFCSCLPLFGPSV